MIHLNEKTILDILIGTAGAIITSLTTVALARRHEEAERKSLAEQVMVSSMEMVNDQVKGIFNGYKEQVEHLRKEVADLRERLERSEKTVEVHDTDRKAAIAAAELARNHASDLLLQLQKAANEITTLLGQNAGLRQDILSLERQVRDLTEEIERLQKPSLIVQ